MIGLVIDNDITIDDMKIFILSVILPVKINMLLRYSRALRDSIYLFSIPMM